MACVWVVILPVIVIMVKLTACEIVTIYLPVMEITGLKILVCRLIIPVEVVQSWFSWVLVEIRVLTTFREIGVIFVYGWVMASNFGIGDSVENGFENALMIVSKTSVLIPKNVKVYVAVYAGHGLRFNGIFMLSKSSWMESVSKYSLRFWL